MDSNKFGFYLTNFITFLRVVGIFLIVPVYKIYGGVETFLLSAFCFITDSIDGILARSLKTSTFFGSLFDALSDKAFLVISMILLMSISPFAILPVIFELCILLVQSIKYDLGLNIQSNKFGKIKMWIAGIIISLSYLFTEDYLVSDFKFKFGLNNLNDTELFMYLFLPLVLFEIITLFSYIKEAIKENKNLSKEAKDERKKKEKIIEKEMNKITLNDILFKNVYYEKYKDYGNLKLIRALAKGKRGI